MLTSIVTKLEQNSVYLKKRAQESSEMQTEWKAGHANFEKTKRSVSRSVALIQFLFFILSCEAFGYVKILLWVTNWKEIPCNYSRFT